jgi:hypothetical protein
VLTDVMNSKNVGVLEGGPLFANSVLLAILRFHVRVKNRNLTGGLLCNAWTLRQNYALQSAQESGHRSQIRLSASERCAATSTERNEGTLLASRAFARFLCTLFYSGASGLTIEAIQSRIIGKRNPFFSMASVINYLWPAKGSTSKK